MTAQIIPLPPSRPSVAAVPPPPARTSADWAAIYAAAGFPPIAVRPNDKRPLAIGWQTATLEDTRALLNANPAANVGIAVPAGLVVLDVDTKHDGPAVLAAFEIEHEKLPDTLRAITPSGGSHYWFKLPPGASIPNAVAFAPGLDVRAPGKGYVVAAPSTIDGKPYRWENWGTPPAHIPDWLLQAMRSKTPAADKPRDGEPFRIPEGMRNQTLFDAAAAMRRAGFSATTTGTAIASMNAEACAVPLDDAEVATIIGSACKYGPNVTPWQMDFGESPLPPGASLENPAGVDPEALGAIVPLDVQGNAFEPLPHCVDQWIPLDEVTLLAGHGGGGKSYIALSLAVHVALGRPFGPLLTTQTNVLFFSAEDSARVLQLRLARICRMLGITPSQLRGKLVLLDVSDTEPALFRKSALPALDRLAALAEKHNAGLVVIDNASDAFDGDEIKRAEVRAFVRALRARIARPSRAVLLLAHINKGSAISGKGAGTEDYSGSTAWHNSVRSRLSLNPAGIDTPTVDHMKANHGPKASPVRLEWRDGVPVVVTGALVDYEAEAARREDQKQALVEVVRKIEAKGDRVPTGRHGPHSTFNALRTFPDFPDGLDRDHFLQFLGKV